MEIYKIAQVIATTTTEHICCIVLVATRTAGQMEGKVKEGIITIQGSHCCREWRRQRTINTNDDKTERR